MFERQDAKGRTSASANSRMNFPGMMMSLWVRNCVYAWLLRPFFSVFNLFSHSVSSDLTMTSSI